MNKLQTFLKLLSIILPIKVPAGRGTTVDNLDTPEPDQNRLIINAPKYKVKSDITFIYVSSRRDSKGEVCHELLCDKTKLTFLVSDKLFRSLFQNVSLNTRVM